MIEEFLKESNAIEGVYDEDSLQQAMYAWNYLEGEKEMSINAILKTHKILMLHQPRLRPNEKGYLREIPVFIGNRETLNWKLIRTRLSKLVENINDVVVNGQKENETFLEGIAKRHHIEFEKIHPFVDGNGRIGRMLLNWERLKVGLPVLIIKESERNGYYQWFK